jgi:hypothetical protein
LGPADVARSERSRLSLKRFAQLEYMPDILAGERPDLRPAIGQDFNKSRSAQQTQGFPDHAQTDLQRGRQVRRDQPLPRGEFSRPDSVLDEIGDRIDCVTWRRS